MNFAVNESYYERYRWAIVQIIPFCCQHLCTGFSISSPIVGVIYKNTLVPKHQSSYIHRKLRQRKRSSLLLKVINSIEDQTEFILGFKYSRSGGALTKSLYLFFAAYKSAPVWVELSRSQNSGSKRAWLPTVHCPTSGRPPGSEVFSENLFLAVRFQL